MKVLFTFGGIPHYLDALLNKLQQKGVDICVVIPDKGNSTIGEGVRMVNGGQYKRISTPEKKGWYGKSSFPQLPGIITAEQPDIVVLGWSYFLQIFFSPKLRKSLRLCGARLVIREIPFQVPPYGKIREYFKTNPMYDENMRLLSRGTLFYIRQWVISKIRKYCYSKVAGTLNYSTAAYDILPSYGVDKSIIHVTYNSTDTASLLNEAEKIRKSEPILPPSGRRILHIGRLVKWKRVDLLIDALPIVLRTFPDAELVVVGDGPELENLKRQAEKLNLTGHINFVGAVYSPEQLGAYMNESTVYVLAGMGGLSINDAMTYGLPVICSVCDTTERDLVTENINGFFFEEGNAASLADKINQLFSTPGLSEAMGKESERIIKEEINLETVSERFLEAFRQIMKENSRLN